MASEIAAGGGVDLVEVPIELLSPENATDVELYLRLKGDMVLYKKNGIYLPKARIDSLIRQGVRVFYLQKDVVGHFLEETGKEIKNLLLAHKPSVQELRNVHKKLTDFSSSLLAVPSEETINLSVSVAGSLAECFEKNEDISTQVLFILEKDIATSIHIANVHFLVAGFSHFLGYRGDELRKMSAAGMLHDIGKALVPEFILKKPGKLTDEEFEEIKKHTTYGRDILRNNGGDEFIPVALYHHENIDGTGYPMGLKKDDIPPEALIVKVCDIYEALTGYRPYRNPFKPFAAAKLMVEDFVKENNALPMDLMEKFIAFVGAAKL